MRKYFFITLLFSLSYSQLDNTETISKTGTTSAQFLKIGADARVHLWVMHLRQCQVESLQCIGIPLDDIHKKV